MASLLLAVIYLAFISLGLPDSIFGAGWPAMHQTFQVSVSYAGIVSMIGAGATILSSLLSDRLIKKFTAKAVVTVSVLTTAVALLGYSFAGQFWQLCLWAIPYGLGAGAIDAALNNYVALHYSARHMSWLHCFWGVGTMVSPYVMSFALTHSGWQSGYRIISCVQFGIAAVLLLALPLWKVHRKDAETGAWEAEAKQSVDIRHALRLRGVPATLVGFFCYCSMEATCMLWAASYLVGTRGVTEVRAAAFASLFFIGITVGRFLSGLLAERLGDASMIRLGTSVIAVGLVLLLIPGLPEWATLAGLVTVGLGCAPIYPAIIHATPKKFGATYSQTVIGLQMASAYTGTLLSPLLLGWLCSRIGLWTLPIFLAVLAGCMIFLLELSHRRAKTKTD